METASLNLLRFEHYTLDLARCALLRGEQEIRLRPKAFDALRYLAERPGRVVTKDELHKAIWPGIVVTDDSLVQSVKFIRDALGDDSDRIIKTVPRRATCSQPRYGRRRRTRLCGPFRLVGMRTLDNLSIDQPRTSGRCHSRLLERSPFFLGWGSGCS